MEEEKDSVWQITLVCLLVALLLVTSLICICRSWRSILNNEQWCICQICCLILLRCRSNVKKQCEENGTRERIKEECVDAHVFLHNNEAGNLTIDMINTNIQEQDIL